MPGDVDSSRTIRYALGVGAGTVDGLDELAFVTENTAGVAQRVLPSGRYAAPVTGIYDKGSGALVRTEGLLTGEDGTPLARLAGGPFIRGEGGFGGDRGPASNCRAVIAGGAR